MRISVTVEGTVIEVQSTREYGSNGFRKSSIVIDTGGEYPDKFKVDWIKDKADQAANDIPEGAGIKVEAYLNGREWNGKYFTGLTGIRWKFAGHDATEPTPADLGEPDEMQETIDGDMPF
jgi:single-strand DNA-binding protein